MEENTDTVVDTAPAPATPDTNTQTTTQTPTNQTSIEPSFAIPDEYKDRGWASKVKSYDDTFKQIDNLSSLVGKKEVYKPTDWNDENSRNEFYKTMRPEKAEDYALPEVFSKEEASVYQNLLHENGISKYQAEKIFGKLAEMRSKAHDANGMTEELKKSWGNDVEAKTKQAVTGLKTLAKPEDLALFDQMPNNVLAAVYRTVSNIMDKYGAKETDIAASSPSNPAKVDVNAQRKDLLKQIMAENNNPNVNWEKLANLKAQLSATYK